MDSLQDAIEKARRQRDGSIGRTVPPGRDAGASPRREQEAPPAPAAAPPQEYRQVELNPAHLAGHRVIAGDPRDSRAEPYRQLRSQVLRSMNANQWRTLSITSANEDAGKTLTAVNLAVSISQESNQTVMLVDLDLGNPAVHSTLGIEVDKGLLDHVLHREPLDGIMIQSSLPRLTILPGTPQSGHTSEILSSREMKAFIEEIVTRNPDEILIFDLPPLLRNDDAMVFLPRSDACLLVVEDGVTRAEELDRALQLVQGTHVLGTVLNKVL